MPDHEIAVLERRYRRLLRFDRGVWIAYALTALLPAYAFFVFDYGHFFHAIGFASALTVALFGWWANTQLLFDRTESEVPAYLVTSAFLVSRLAVATAGFFAVREQMERVFGSPLLGYTLWDGISSLLVSPVVAYLIFFFAFYRFIYHVSVHFLLKIQRRKAAEPGATDNPDDAQRLREDH